MQTISPFLWFDDQAEQAAARYVEIFPNSRIVSVARYGEGAPQPAGTAMSVSFVLDGVEVQALNGGPMYAFTEAFSFFVSVPDQAEVDRVWDALTADGGEPGRCGWLKDRWGLSWQIVPEALMRYQADPDRDKAGRVFQAMLTMRKIIVADLDAAYAG